MLMWFLQNDSNKPPRFRKEHIYEPLGGSVTRLVTQRCQGTTRFIFLVVPVFLENNFNFQNVVLLQSGFNECII